MDEPVIIYTQAYNMERTLQRTIDSVCAQTHQNWVWLLIENGSSDGTAKIILDAALKDCRIIPLGLKENEIDAWKWFLLQLKRVSPDGYFMELDSDDTISPDCLERLLLFSQANELDIAVCGTRAVYEGRVKSGYDQKSRVPDSDLFLQGSDFAEQFPVYKTYTNELWAKLYRTSLMREDGRLDQQSIYHNDSLLVLDLFRNAEKVGILSQTLHTQYLREGSDTFDRVGIHSLDTLPRQMRPGSMVEYGVSWEEINKTIAQYEAYLRSYGELSQKNREYLSAIYIGWIHQNLVQMYLAAPFADDRLLCERLYGLLCSDAFREVFACPDVTGIYHNLRRRGEILRQMRWFMDFGGVYLKNPPLADAVKAELKKREEGLKI